MIRSMEIFGNTISNPGFIIVTVSARHKISCQTKWNQEKSVNDQFQKLTLIRKHSILGLSILLVVLYLLFKRSLAPWHNGIPYVSISRIRQTFANRKFILHELHLGTSF